jgi:hypothetical protein
MGRLGMLRGAEARGVVVGKLLRTCLRTPVHASTPELPPDHATTLNSLLCPLRLHVESSGLIALEIPLVLHLSLAQSRRPSTSLHPVPLLPPLPPVRPPLSLLPPPLSLLPPPPLLLLMLHHPLTLLLLVLGAMGS